MMLIQRWGIRFHYVAIYKYSLKHGNMLSVEQEEAGWICASDIRYEGLLQSKERWGKR